MGLWNRHILPHGSYLVNLAQIDEVKAEQAYGCFLDDLKRCEMLKIGLYNFQYVISIEFSSLFKITLEPFPNSPPLMIEPYYAVY